MNFAERLEIKLQRLCEAIYGPSGRRIAQSPMQQKYAEILNTIKDFDINIAVEDIVYEQIKKEFQTMNQIIIEVLKLQPKVATALININIMLFDKWISESEVKKQKMEILKQFEEKSHYTINDLLKSYENIKILAEKTEPLYNTRLKTMIAIIKNIQDLLVLINNENQKKLNP